MMITKVLAIAAIKADAYCTSTFDENGVETVTYEDGVTPIDESLVDAKVKELKAIQAYQSKRVAEYPKIEEQFNYYYDNTYDWYVYHPKLVTDSKIVFVNSFALSNI